MHPQLDQLVKTLEPYFTKQAPIQLPETWRQTIVKFSPIIALILAILSAVAILALFPFLGFASIAGSLYVPDTGFNLLLVWIHLGLLVVSTVLLFMAYPGLKAVNIKGWNYLFYGLLVGVVGTVVNVLSGDIGSLLSGAVNFLIGAYITFQIRDYFTGAKKLTNPPAPATTTPTTTTASAPVETPAEQPKAE